VGCGCQGSSYQDPDLEGRRQARQEARAERIREARERRESRKVASITDPSLYADWQPPSKQGQ
jgi:hypothetical protein